MDSQPELLGAQVPESTNSSNTKPSSSSRKRGITRGVSLLVQPDRKKVLKTNEFGQPNEDCSDHRDFASHVGVLTRSHIPIIYQDFRRVPHDQIRMVTERLSQFYEFEGQSWDASLEYVIKRINEAWRNYKRRLTAKYIKDKDPTAVRDGPAPPGIPVEDWRVFVDQRTTEEFKRVSVRNKINRAKLKGPACLGRHSMAVTRHKMAKEKNLTSDAEISRCEVFLRAHTRKDKVVQYPDLVEKLEELSSSNPASRMTGMDDALTELVGSDKRGRMRGLGCSISKVGLKKSAPARSKVENVTKEKEGVVQELTQVKKKLDDVTQDIVEMKKTLVDMQKGRESSQNLSSPTVVKSTQASSPDIIYIGKRCDLLGFGKRGVVARGEVHEVNSNATVHCEPLEDGAFVVILTEIVQPHAPLWKEDGFASTLGEVGLGSFVQWGKEALRIQ